MAEHNNIKWQYRPNVYKIIIQPYYAIVILSQNVIDGNQPTIHIVVVVLTTTHPELLVV